MNIIIGGAWPYANNSLHLGHLAGLISGDVLARFHRLKGDNVLYVSGTDCHGTPITERAKKEGRTPKEIADMYDAEFRKTFLDMGFSYDLYTNTETEYHKKESQAMFRKLYDNGYIYEKLEPQAFCETCNKFLSDREIFVTCPKCGKETRADQCEFCEYVPQVEDLKGGTCLTCKSKTVEKQNKNLYFALSKFQKEIESYVQTKKSIWRTNAMNETEKYVKQGLLDRAVTRDLNWGIDVPVDGYEAKKMYVWIEAVWGYYSTSKRLCEDRKLNIEDFWEEGKDNKIYMALGKDNIVFHSIIFNSMLLGLKEKFHLVDQIVSTEYLNINDEKISKSKGNGFAAKDALEKYNADSLRYYLIANGPEKKDSNFSIADFEKTHNGEILNKFGNLVNRTLKFKGLEELPNGKMDEAVEEQIKEVYVKVEKLVEKLEFKDATREIMILIENANKYYDEQKPWVQKNENMEAFNNTIYTCGNIIANLSNLLEPIMPFSAEKIRRILEIKKPSWDYVQIAGGVKLENIEALFTRI